MNKMMMMKKWKSFALLTVLAIPCALLLASFTAKNSGNTPTSFTAVTLDAVAPTVLVNTDNVIVNKFFGRSLVPLAEGPHMALVQVADAVGIAGSAMVNFAVDAAPPTVTINPVTTPTHASSQPLAGAVDSGAVVTITADTATSIGTISYPTSTSWACTITDLTPGNTTFTITAVDATGNSSNASATINYITEISAALSPQGIAGDFKGDIVLTMGNLSAAGNDLFVEQYVDANHNGTVDAGDFVIRSFRVTDGTASANPNVQGDEDGAANSAIVTSLNYYLPNDLYHAPGYYVFRVTSGSDTTSTPFVVSAASQPQSISGTVTGYAATLPGAIVQLADKWQRPVAFTMADENGRYTLYVKDVGEYLVTPASYGYAASTVQTPVTIAAGQTVTGYDLTLLPGVFQVAGRLKDTITGAGIDGVWVKANGTAVSGVAITGADGGFSLILPAGLFSIATAADPTIPNPSTKGYLGFNKLAVTTDVATDVNVPDIGLPQAGVLVSGRTLTAQGVPVPGMPVQGRIPAVNDVKEPVTFGVTNASGDYALAFTSGASWNISLKDSSAQSLGYIGNGIGNFSTTSSLLTGNDLTVYPITAWIQGTVKESNNNPIAGSDIQLKNSDSSPLSSGLNAQTTGTSSSGPGWVLTFSDEFAASSLDRAKWRTDFPWGARALGNGDKQYYIDNAFTFPSPGTGGYLQINTSQQNTADPDCLGGVCAYTSGMIASYPYFGQKYGYFEMRAQISAGMGLWPAFWMLPVYNVWPPEVDIMEVGGSNTSTVYMNMLTLPSNTWHLGSTSAAGDMSIGMHTYAVNWSPGVVIWYIDGVERHRVTDVEVPSEAMYVVADMAIGGSWSAIGYPDSATATKIANDTVPMKIDYIRVYQKSSNGDYATIPGPTPIPTMRGSLTPVAASVATVADGTYRLGALAGYWLVDDVTHNNGLQLLEQAVTLADSQSATVNFVVDVTPPALAINPVSTPTTSKAQTITGTAEAGSTVTVAIDTSASVTLVSFPTQSTWSCSISGLVGGSNNITVTATDVNGNTASATTQISVIIPPPATITATADSNGSISPSGAVKVAYGASQAFAIAPNTGYHVADVKVDGVSKGAITSYTFTNVSADHTITVSFAINTSSVSSVALNPTSVVGGSTSQGTVTLSGPAPSSGVAVSLSDNSSAASVPASIMVPNGSTSATFMITTTPVTSSRTVIISAVTGVVTKTATLTVNPPVLSTFSVIPTSVRGGTSSLGTVTLSGPAPSGGVVVSLSDNSSAASVPAGVTVPSGSSSATFTITTTPVSSSRSVTISAVYGGVTKTAALTVTTPVLSTFSFSVSPTSVRGGTSSLGTVTLSGPAPSGGVVVLLSDNSSAASVPASVTVPSGSSSATFTISTTPVSSSRSITISAVYGGVTKTAALTVTTPVLSAFSVSPTSVKGGTTSRGTVTLSGPAPSGGMVVLLSDNSSAASELASITIPSGSSSATFTISTTPVSSSRSVTISAVCGGVTKTATFTVTR